MPDNPTPPERPQAWEYRCGSCNTHMMGSAFDKAGGKCPVCGNGTVRELIAPMAKLEEHIKFFHEGCGGILLGEIPGPYSCAECGKHIDLVCKILGPARIPEPTEARAACPERPRCVEILGDFISPDVEYKKPVEISATALNAMSKAYLETVAHINHLTAHVRELEYRLRAWQDIDGERLEKQDAERDRLIKENGDLRELLRKSLQIARPWIDGKLTYPEWDALFTEIDAALSKEPAATALDPTAQSPT